MKISQIPDGHEQPHRVDAAVPAVEVADEAHAIGVRRPHGEVHAGRRPDGDAVRAELLERAMVRALAEQVQIEIGQHAAVAVRIVDLDAMVGVAVGAIGDPQAVVGRLSSTGAPRRARPGAAGSSAGARRSRASADLDRPRRRLQRPHDPSGPDASGAARAPRTDPGSRRRRRREPSRTARCRRIWSSGHLVIWSFRIWLQFDQ